MLTPAGERLAALARSQLQALEEFRKEQAGLPRAFVIGSGSSTMEWLVAPALPTLSAALGGARILTGMHRSQPLVEVVVREGRVDLAVVRGDDYYRDDLAVLEGSKTLADVRSIAEIKAGNSRRPGSVAATSVHVPGIVHCGPNRRPVQVREWQQGQSGG